MSATPVNGGATSPAASIPPSRASAPALAIREAVPDDHEFILELILDGARNGHFDRRVLIPPQHGMLREEIDAIIKRRRLLNEPLNAQALIFSNGTDRVGHAIMTEVKNTAGAELYAMAVDGRWRGAGIGAAMLDMLIVHYLPRMGAIYARCFPRSVVMYELLVSRGFEYVLTTRAGLRIMRRVHPDANIPLLP